MGLMMEWKVAVGTAMGQAAAGKVRPRDYVFLFHCCFLGVQFNGYPGVNLLLLLPSIPFHIRGFSLRNNAYPTADLPMLTTVAFRHPRRRRGPR